MRRARWKDRPVCSMLTLCRRAHVDRAAADRLFDAIVDAAMDGERINIPNFGQFAIDVLQGGPALIPLRNGTTRHGVTQDSFLLNFHRSGTLGHELRRRARGRSIVPPVR